MTQAKDKFIEQKEKFQEHLESIMAAKDEEIAAAEKARQEEIDGMWAAPSSLPPPSAFGTLPRTVSRCFLPTQVLAASASSLCLPLQLLLSYPH
jgi:hypothetical protein